VPDWLKIFVMIIGLGGWLATVVVTLWQGKLPDAATLGIPAALVLALAPPVTIGRRRGTTSRRRAVPAAETAGDEST
jgi:hypothetical protein